MVNYFWFPDNENDGASDDSDGKFEEVRFVPADKSKCKSSKSLEKKKWLFFTDFFSRLMPKNFLFIFSVEVMFRAMSDCQILHPDPQEQEEGKLCASIACKYRRLSSLPARYEMVDSPWGA